MGILQWNERKGSWKSHFPTFISSVKHNCRKFLSCLFTLQKNMKDDCTLFCYKFYVFSYLPMLINQIINTNKNNKRKMCKKNSRVKIYTVKLRPPPFNTIWLLPISIFQLQLVVHACLLRKNCHNHNQHHITNAAWSAGKQRFIQWHCRLKIFNQFALLHVADECMQLDIISDQTLIRFVECCIRRDGVPAQIMY